MDERSYTQVARILNAYGVWTSWCSTFLTAAGFKLIGLPHLERSLRSAGWEGTNLTLYADVEIGGGFGYGNLLVDEGKFENKGDKERFKAAYDHVHEHHSSYVTEGKRTACVIVGKAAHH